MCRSFFIDGQFGAMMSVGLTNEGPVTFTLDSRLSESTPASGISTPNPTTSKADGKKARRAVWEAAKKEKMSEGDQDKEEPTSTPAQSGS
jgi:D-aminoacyl-tRNA deacylase